METSSHLLKKPTTKSITVSILGAPNVGKSTLLNSLLGEELAIVSPTPQTTRNKLRCITVVDNTEIILTDTPGHHRPSVELNQRLNQQAWEGLQGAELNLLLLDITKNFITQWQDFKRHLLQTPFASSRKLAPFFLVFTKVDLSPLSYEEEFKRCELFFLEQQKEQQQKQEYEGTEENALFFKKFFLISSHQDKNLDELVVSITDEAPLSRHLYPEGDLSDRSERFFVSEFIREQAFNLLKDEVPHQLAVFIESFEDLRESSSPICHIAASIVVNKQSQKPIVIGQKGQRIKEIGTLARQKIEKLLGSKVLLNLHVKVSPGWFKNNFVLEELGLPRQNYAPRAWRKKI